MIRYMNFDLYPEAALPHLAVRGKVISDTLEIIGVDLDTGALSCVEYFNDKTPIFYTKKVDPREVTFILNKALSIPQLFSKGNTITIEEMQTRLTQWLGCRDVAREKHGI